MISFKTKVVIVFAIPFLNGCAVVYPKKIAYYDADCDIRAKKFVLDVTNIRAACNKEPIPSIECFKSNLIAELIAQSVISASSLIISGSIAVVGNTVYWLEKQSKCKTKTIPEINKEDI